MSPDQHIIISLFDFSGTWSQPYRLAGYTVLQIDKHFGHDILKWDYKHLDQSKVFGILSAPPCTHFSKASSIYWDKYDANGLTAHSLLLIQTTLQIIEHFQPHFWCLENPPGRLSKIYPPISKYKLFRFSPSEFGDPLFKLTELYGNFCPLLSRSHTKPTHTVSGKRKSPTIMSYYKYLYPGYSRAALRSITPPGFAKAFYESNRNTAFEESIKYKQKI